MSKKLNDSLSIYLQKDERSEHGGINQEVVVKVGEYVRNSFTRAADDGLLSEHQINLLMDKDWCKDTFHIAHPFLIMVDDKLSFYDQARDKNGYIRYWKKPLQINGKEYYACKEWYENNRKYVSRWISSLSNENKCNISKEMFKKLCEDIRKMDKDDICIKVENLTKQYPEHAKEVYSLIRYLVDEGVLISFQGILREFVIDDYDSFFNMMENVEGYVTKGAENED